MTALVRAFWAALKGGSFFCMAFCNRVSLLQSAGHPDRVMPPKLIPYTLLLLIGVIAGGARADDFTERCAQLPQQAKITVVFHDRQVIANEIGRAHV